MGSSVQAVLSASDLPFVDVTAPDFAWEDPAVSAARESCWVARTPVGLLVLRYAEMSELLCDSRVFSNVQDNAPITSGAFYETLGRSVMSRNGAEHRRLRKPVNLALAPRGIARHRASIREIAQQQTGSLVERLAADGACDVVEVFIDPFVMTVLARLLEIPVEDYTACRRWLSIFSHAFTPGHDYGSLTLDEAAAGFEEYCDGLISERRAHPGTDPLSDIIRAQHIGVLHEDEPRNLLEDTLAGGWHTTAHQLGHALVAFAHHPQQWTLLQDRPELAGQAVTEVIRWQPIGPVLTSRPSLSK